MRRALLLAAITAAVCLAQSNTSRGFVNPRVFSGKLLNGPELKKPAMRPAPKPGWRLFKPRPKPLLIAPTEKPVRIKVTRDR